MATANDIILQLDGFAPPGLADEDDRIGLQVGRRDREVCTLVLSVDTSPPIIDLAIERGAQMLVAHHPLIYTPLARLTGDDPISDSVMRLVRADVTVFVLHTNFDTAPGGTNDVLAKMLGVECLTPLTTRRQDELYKIVVFVPGAAVEHVRNVMAEAGAGVIGRYTHCSFRTPGTGSFVPQAAARPYIGSVGKLEEVDEYRLEMVCAGSRVEEVLREMDAAHPYDEVAYDVISLSNQPVSYGYGRVGVLESETPLVDFAERVRSVLRLEVMKVAGDPDKPVRRVAVCTGGGSSLYMDAVAARADVYVTGDTKHHDILSANAYGLAVIDAGHLETERPGMMDLAERLRGEFAGSNLEIEYIE